MDNDESAKDLTETEFTGYVESSQIDEQDKDVRVIAMMMMTDDDDNTEAQRSGTASRRAGLHADGFARWWTGRRNAAGGTTGLAGRSTRVAEAARRTRTATGCSTAWWRRRARTTADGRTGLRARLIRRARRARRQARQTDARRLGRIRRQVHLNAGAWQS